ncbi:hypothetical protein HOD41_01800, partial [bacterium]|nr:hypothetical protein [bacterium]
MNFKKTIASVAVVSLCLLNIGIASALPTIQSALDETFSKNQAPEQLSNITITEDAEESFIKEGVLKITIPDTLEMIFDTERTVLEFTVFGTAVDNGKVLAEPVLTFEDGDKTLVVPIEEDFEPGEVLTITKCYVEGFHSTSISSDHLELTVNDDPTIYEDSADLNITISTYSDSRDPDAPSNIEIQDTEGGVKMTWTDPTDLDLYRIKILRGKNDAPVDGTPYVEVLPGEEEYIDTDVVEGDTVKYMFRASDGPNTGDTTVEHVFVVGSTIVEEPEAEPEVEPVVEDTDEDPEPVLINEEGFCTLEYLPVCSANGVTYPNSCVAEKSGATVETEGECETPYCEVTDEPVCGVDGITYPNGCSLEKNDIMKAYDGECDIEYCPVEYEPVCAADGETYTNECVAEKAGTEMSTFGECSETEDEPLFTDTETHWAKDKVESMAEKEIVEG